MSSRYYCSLINSCSGFPLNPGDWTPMNSAARKKVFFNHNNSNRDSNSDQSISVCSYFSFL